MKSYISAKYKGMINPYIENGKGGIEWTYPSGQMWLNFSLKDKKELDSVMASMGESLEYYINELRKVSPDAEPWPK